MVHHSVTPGDANLRALAKTVSVQVRKWWLIELLQNASQVDAGPKWVPAAWQPQDLAAIRYFG